MRKQATQMIRSYPTPIRKYSSTTARSGILNQVRFDNMSAAAWNEFKIEAEKQAQEDIREHILVNYFSDRKDFDRFFQGRDPVDDPIWLEKYRVDILKTMGLNLNGENILRDAETLDHKPGNEDIGASPGLQNSQATLNSSNLIESQGNNEEQDEAIQDDDTPLEDLIHDVEERLIHDAIDVLEKRYKVLEEEAALDEQILKLLIEKYRNQKKWAEILGCGSYMFGLHILDLMRSWSIH